MSGSRKGSFGFVFFMLIILAGSAFLLRAVWMPHASRLLHGPESSSLPAGGTGLSISLREDKAAELLTPYLAQALSADLQTLSFGDGRIAIAANVRVNALIDETVAKSMPEMAMVKAVLPATAAVAMEFAPGVQNGAPALMPTACRIGGYPIPVGLIPRAVIDAMNHMIADQTAAYGVQIASIQSGAGVLTITMS